MDRREFIKTIACSLTALSASSIVRCTQTEGIETRVKSWGNGNHAFIIEASSGRYCAEIVTAKEITDKDTSTSKEIQEKTGAYVVTNGGFFEPDYSPSGLLICKRKMINDFTLGKGDGILYTDSNGQANIIRRNDFDKRKKEIVDAVQLTLLSIGNNKLHNKNYEDRMLPRTLVGINNNGLVGVVFKSTNFAYADNYMRKTFGCSIVAALDGYFSSSAYDKFGRTSFRKGDVKEIAVPNFFVLY